MTDRGAATVYAAGAGLFLMMAGLTVALKSSHLVTAAQARNAADFAALAGAARAGHGERLACARAAEIANRNAAEMTSCALSGFEIVVIVHIEAVSATARAGPVRAE